LNPLEADHLAAVQVGDHRRDARTERRAFGHIRGGARRHPRLAARASGAEQLVKASCHRLTTDARAVPTLGRSLTKALEVKDPKMFRNAIDDLYTLLPHLSTQRKVVLSAALTCFGQFHVARATYKTGNLGKKIARKLLLR
jgi:hypothetical protein